MEYIDCNVYHHSFVGKDPHHWHGILSMLHVRKLKRGTLVNIVNIVNIVEYCEYCEHCVDNHQSCRCFRNCILLTSRE